MGAPKPSSFPFCLSVCPLHFSSFPLVDIFCAAAELWIIIMLSLPGSRAASSSTASWRRDRTRRRTRPTSSSRWVMINGQGGTSCQHCDHGMHWCQGGQCLQLPTPCASHSRTYVARFLFWKFSQAKSAPLIQVAQNQFLTGWRKKQNNNHKT